MPAPESLTDKIEALARRLEAMEQESRALKAENETLRRQSKQDAATIERLNRENQELRRRLDRFIRQYFGGRKNEGLSRDQLELALQGLAPVIEEAPAAPAPASPPPPSRPPRERTPRRALDDERLERRQTVIEPEEVKADPAGWTKIGEERTVQLDYQPGKLLRHEIIRPRYVRREEFAIAPLPAQPIDKGMVGAGLLAWLLMSKYVDHLPLHRLAGILHRQHGVEIPRNTISGWVEQSTDLLMAVYRAMREKQRKRTYLQVDETPVRFLDPDSPGSSQLGYLWVYLDPGGEVVFQWNESRGHQAPKEFLGDYRGVIQVDGFSAYQTLMTARDGLLVLAHCWAHARRKIQEAAGESAWIAAWIQHRIQAMYLIESQLREAKAGPALRAAVRSSETTPILNRLLKGIEILRARQLPGGALAKAMDYILERREGLSRFLKDGRIEIDSNLVENAIRPCALGRKNWLFVGHPNAGERPAVFYSLMASCRLHEIDPFEYLRDVLTRLPGAKSTDIERFTPSAWAKAKRAAKI